MSGGSLGRRVLELATDQSKLNQGLSQARATVLRDTARINNEAKIRYQADLQALKTANQQVLIDARSTRRLVEQQTRFQYRIDLEKYRTDLRAAERERAASLRRMQQEQGSGGIGGFARDLLSGVGIGSGATVASGAILSGFQAVQRAGEAAISTIFNYNAAVQSATTNIRAFTGSQEAVAKTMAIADRELERGRSGYQETLTALAELTPLSRRYGASLQELLTTTQLLAALDPGQGFAGASIALREALSGDYVSLARRFEIPRSELQRLKDEGLPNLEVVRRALAGLGITEAVLEQRTQTLSQRLIIATDTLRRFVAETGRPLANLGSEALAGGTRLLNDPALERAGRQFSEDLANNLNDAKRILSDPALRDAVRDLGAALQDAAGAARGLGGAAKDLAIVGGVIDLAALRGGAAILKVTLDTLVAIEEQTGAVSVVLREMVGALPGAAAIVQLSRVSELLREIALLQQLTGPQERIGSQVRPTTVAAAPQTEAAFDISAASNASRRQADLYKQGQEDLRNYLAGFSSADFDLYGKIGPEVKAAFDRAFGDLDPAQQFQRGLAGLDGLSARIVADLRQLGRVSDETAAVARDALGNQANAVINLANEYARLAQAQAGVRASTLALGAAQSNLNRVQSEAAASVAAAQRAVEVARGQAQTNQQQAETAVDDLQRQLTAIERQARAAANAYDDQIRGLQSALATFQRQAEEAQREYQRAIAAAQQEQSALQEQASRNAAAYAAVLAGTTDEYERQNAELSEQERQIIANGNAQVRAALQAKAAQDELVQGLEERERALSLSFEERIRAARRKGGPEGEREARALEEQRDRELAKLRYQLDLERQRAAVRADEANRAKEPVEEAAKAQAAEDKKRVEEAEKRVAELEDQARLRAESDRAAAEAIQDRLAGVQEEARRSAEMYEGREQGVRDEITAIQDRAREQATADAAAIRGAETALELVKQIEERRVNAARQAVTNAQLQQQAAQSEYRAQQDTLTLMGQKQTALDKYLETWKEFIDYLKSENIPVPQFFGAPAPVTSPSPAPGGGVSEGSGESVGGQPTLKPPAAPPPQAPPGSGDPGFFGRVPLPASARYRAPVPPSSSLASFSTMAGAGGGGGGLLSRARGPVSLTGPFLTMPNATINQGVDIEQAAIRGAELAGRAFLAALDEDDAGGGSQSTWGSR